MKTKIISYPFFANILAIILNPLKSQFDTELSLFGRIMTNNQAISHIDTNLYHFDI